MSAEVPLRWVVRHLVALVALVEVLVIVVLILLGVV